MEDLLNHSPAAALADTLADVPTLHRSLIYRDPGVRVLARAGAILGMCLQTWEAEWYKQPPVSVS